MAGKSNDLSPSAHRRALRLRLERIHRKIAKVQEEAICFTHSCCPRRWQNEGPGIIVPDSPRRRASTNPLLVSWRNQCLAILLPNKIEPPRLHFS